MTSYPALPLETYRGVCNAWECDENGHMNVRFYAQRAQEGLVGVAIALGIPEAFRARTNATLIPVDQHIRFVREARPGAPLHMAAGVVGIGENTAQVYQELRHLDGSVAATISTVIMHADPASGRAFAWSKRVRERVGDVMCTVPPHGRPRSIDVTRLPGDANTTIADALGVSVVGRGAFLDSETDVFGRVRPEAAFGRISDSAPNLLQAWRHTAAEEAGAGAAHAGAAVVEYRIVYRRWPRAGDGYVMRSAVTETHDKTMRIVHWGLDPVSGQAWFSAEVVALTFDLVTRKAIQPGPRARAALEAMRIDAMTM